MINYVINRVVWMVVLLVIVSITAFVVIELPPGDFLTAYISTLQTGLFGNVGLDEAEVLRERYGLDQPMVTRYLKWMRDLLRGDPGMSLAYERPVKDLIGERLPATVGLTLVTMIFTFAVAIPIGIYSATHQYSIGDYAVSTVGFLGLATPNFLLALVLMLLMQNWFGVTAGGLFSPEFVREPWSFAKFIDLLKHLPVPIIVVGTAGTAGLIRVMRAVLLDELRKQYVITARAKGVSEKRLLIKYPVRVAINPVVSTISWLLPAIVSGETITAVVLNLPTTGPLLLDALRKQDMYLAGTIILLLSALTVIGTFLSDILLAVVDPRIRYSKGTR